MSSLLTSTPPSGEQVGQERSSLVPPCGSRRAMIVSLLPTKSALFSPLLADELVEAPCRSHGCNKERLEPLPLSGTAHCASRGLYLLDLFSSVSKIPDPLHPTMARLLASLRAVSPMQGVGCESLFLSMDHLVKVSLKNWYTFLCKKHTLLHEAVSSALPISLRNSWGAWLQGWSLVLLHSTDGPSASDELY